MGFLSSARFYTQPMFDKYMSNVFAFQDWRPGFIVLHNTSEPTLAERPIGFIQEHMFNLRDYYEGLGWHAGPHLFVDDHGIWVFCDLTEPGVHSPSWNGVSWGIEMLGEYDTESATEGRGAEVVHNAVCAMAAMSLKASLDSSTIHFHKEDPLTTHKDCPGSNISKPDIIQRVHNRILALKGGQ